MFAKMFKNTPGNPMIFKSLKSVLTYFYKPEMIGVFIYKDRPIFSN